MRSRGGRHGPGGMAKWVSGWSCEGARFERCPRTLIGSGTFLRGGRGSRSVGCQDGICENLWPDVDQAQSRAACDGPTRSGTCPTVQLQVDVSRGTLCAEPMLHGVQTARNAWRALPAAHRTTSLRSVTWCGGTGLAPICARCHAPSRAANIDEVAKWPTSSERWATCDGAGWRQRDATSRRVERFHSWVQAHPRQCPVQDSWGRTRHRTALGTLSCGTKCPPRDMSSAPRDNCGPAASSAVAGASRLHMGEHAA